MDLSKRLPANELYRVPEHIALSPEAMAKIKAMIAELRQWASWIMLMTREPTEDNMNDEQRPEVPLSEVPRQVADLERVCANLVGTIKKLEKRCASAISSTLKSDQGTVETEQRTLCPLAGSLRTCVRRIETACEDIESLMERMEL